MRPIRSVKNSTSPGANPRSHGLDSPVRTVDTERVGSVGSRAAPAPRTTAKATSAAPPRRAA